MKKVYQTIKDFKHGDCGRACVASILEKDIISVPNFMRNGASKFHENKSKFEKRVGLMFTYIEPGEDNQEARERLENCYSIGVVISPRSPVNKNYYHAVVVYKNRVVHDPYSPDEPVGYFFDGEYQEYLIITDIVKFKRFLDAT